MIADLDKDTRLEGYPWSGSQSCCRGVYYLYNWKEDLLYIGQSVEVEIRIDAHRYGASWGREIEGFRIEMFPNATSSLLLAIESLRIAQYCSTNNITPQFRGGFTTDQLLNYLTHHPEVLNALTAPRWV